MKRTNAVRTADAMSIAAAETIVIVTKRTNAVTNVTANKEQGYEQ